MANTTTELASSAQRRLMRQTAPELWLIAAWVLVMIAIPIVRWVLGDWALRWGVLITVALLSSAVLAILARAWGARRTLAVAAVILPTSWLIEYVGSTTGFPFGAYSYTDLLIPQLGHVPLIIPLAWLMMLPPAWAVATAITRRQNEVAFVLVSALAFTAWDLFLDPQMVGWGYWVWERPGGYFGIPWINFAGWIASAALLTALARPPAVPVLPLYAIYAITWALQSIGQAAFWGMPGPALAGFVGMGVFVLAAWWQGLRPAENTRRNGGASAAPNPVHERSHGPG